MTRDEFLARLHEDDEYAPGWQAIDGAFGGVRNGWGYEMTMKLAEKDVEECLWAVSTMSNLARYTYTTGRPTLPGACIRGDGTPFASARTP